MILRDYQEHLIAQARSVFRAGGRRVLIQSPTGSGKTAMLGYMLGQAARQGKSSLFAVPAREIMLQTMRAFDLQGVDYGVIAAGITPYPEAPVQVAMVPTLARRITKVTYEPALICLDECHHATAGQWGKIYDRWPRAYYVGLTATPCRTDGKPLRGLFDSLILGPYVRGLIDRGYLADYKVYAPPVGINTDGVRMAGGDFDTGQLADAVNKPTITGCAVSHYHRITPGRRAVVACVNVSHSKQVAADFAASGVASEHVDGGMRQGDRDAIISRFASGKTIVLCQVGIINEGVDIPGIEVVISLRPTKSLSRWLQLVGRSLRPKQDGSIAVILDHAGNTIEHGLPDDVREWSLDGAIGGGGKKKKKEITTPIKQCEKCFFIFRPAPKCPSCGHIREAKQLEEDKFTDLQEINPEDLARKAKAREVGQARTLEDLLQIEVARKYKPGWARHVMRSRLARGNRRG